MHRILVYLALSLALALAVPLLWESDRRRVTKTREVVILSALALTPRALAPACPRGAPEASQARLASFGDIAAALAKLSKAWPQRSSVFFLSRQPADLARALGAKGRRYFCFSLAAKTYRLQPWRFLGDRRWRLFLVGLDPKEAARAPLLDEARLDSLAVLKNYSAYLERLAGRAWASRRAGTTRPPKTALPRGYDGGRNRSMTEALDHMNRVQRYLESRSARARALIESIKHRPYFRRLRSKMAPRDMKALLKSLGQDPSQGRFRLKGYLIRARVEKYTVPVAVVMAGLRAARLVAAGLLLLLAIWALGKAYPRLPGIMINPRWVGVFADAIFITAGAFGAYALWDSAAGQWWGALPKLEEALRVVMGWMYLPAMLFCAWFAANLSGQSLQVSEKGLTRHAPGGATTIAWDQVEGFATRDSHVPVGRMGLVMPRRLQTQLIIQTQRGILSLFEPGRRATKRAIMELLVRHAPQRLQADLRRVGRDW